uniref:Uncharacterized protein n=1 Tax=viral metagenome TaxID=1070528 RepID=A0A6C0EZG9_9ZZZZ
MTTTTNRRIKKKEEIVSRAIQILTKYLTETNGFQKIKEIVCNNVSINRAEKANKIFHIIFSSESVNALLENMKLTGTAKSGIGIFKASKSFSSIFSRKTKTTRINTITSRLNDPIVNQVDSYLKPESLPIIERALEPLTKSCLSADFFQVVQSQCIKPIIKHVASGADVENYFSGGFRKMAAASSRKCRTRGRTRSRTRGRS